MKRIDTLTAVADLFGPGKAGFRDGDLAIGQLPTGFNAAWPNGVQEELLAIIEAAGLVPNGDTLNQVLQALRTPGLFGGRWDFVSNGTLVVPNWVTVGWATGCGGGGGGAGTPNVAANTVRSGGGGGGAGQSVYRMPLLFVPGTTYAVVIGAAGAGGTVSSPLGVSGGATLLGPAGALLNLAGGVGGATGNSVSVTGGVTSSSGGVGGAGSPDGAGGQDASTVGASSSGGTGGSSPFGGGGAGGRGASAAATGPSQNCLPGHAGGGYGAGGGGAGGDYGMGGSTTVSSSGAAGGSGRSGILTIEW